MRHEKHTIGELTVDTCSLHGSDLGRGQKWYLDGTYGSNGNSGKTAGTALQTLAAGESTLTAEQNDTLLVAPENVLVPTEIAWDKDNTHIFGLGGPNTRGGDYGAYFYSIAADLAQIINVTGKRCQISRVTFGNHGNNAACVAAMLVNGEGLWLRDVQLIGNINAAQAQDADCASLIIHTDGSRILAENCVIGNNVNTGIRNQAASGQLLFTSAVSGPDNGKFIGCTFLSRAETVTVPMVAVQNGAGIDRLWEFEDCMFHNFWINWADTCERVFYIPGMSTCTIALTGTSNCIGYDEWQDSDQDKLFQCSLPEPSIKGGLAVEPTTA